MPPENEKKKQSSCRLEIYIKEDGSLVFTPLTNNTSPVLKAISRKLNGTEKTSSTYCG